MIHAKSKKSSKMEKDYQTWELPCQRKGQRFL